jgi:hypothetical protein
MKSLKGLFTFAVIPHRYPSRYLGIPNFDPFLALKVTASENFVLARKM